MKEFEYIIKDPDGIHARPAGELVKLAKGFESDITISAKGKTADAKKIFGVMGLAIKQGDAVKIKVDGTDENLAASVIENYLIDNM